MFYDKLIELCNSHNEKLTPLLEKLDISTGNISRWKSGFNNISAENLQKIADYFNVSVDYLLGRTPVKDLIIPQSMGSLPLAFNGGTEGLTQEDIDSVNDYIEFIKNKKKDKNDK